MLSDQAVKPLKAGLAVITIILLGISGYATWQDQITLSNYFMSGSILTGLLYIHIDNINHRVKTINTLETLHKKLERNQEENEEESDGSESNVSQENE